MASMALHILVLLYHIESLPDINRWLADDAQIVNLSLHKQMFQMVQMVRYSYIQMLKV